MSAGLTHAVPAAHAYSAVTTVHALERLLDELVEMLMTVDPAVYRARPAAPVSGSVGEHVRHALDHIAALSAVSPSADPSFELSYDHRERGTEVEAEPDAAVRQIFRLQAALDRWMGEPLDRPILVATRVTSGGDTVAGWSSLARELTFVISHTIHHQAVIALLLAWQGVGVADRFGYAPSTPASPARS